MKNRIITFYLPQFHPVAENDRWWGKGFTEWTNVAKAQPRFPGHHQPHVPADLGFYDLRLPETRKAQAELAKAYGINGFCYYHYWFNGKLMLETPLQAVLRSGEPDFPFCICWANENWTRAWDGMEREVLLQQDYSLEDAENHIRHLLTIITDKRYIRVHDRPLVLIYRPDIIPDLQEMIKRWRAVAGEVLPQGIFLAGVRNSFSELSDQECLDAGFDAVVDFQPKRADFPQQSNPRFHLKEFLKKYLPAKLYQNLRASVVAETIINYKDMVSGILKKEWPKTYVKFPCVFPSWDNSARRKAATIIQNDDPALFGAWLDKAIKDVGAYPEEERIVFINAWNEWAEGCHLEPDLVNKHGFLQAVARSQNLPLPAEPSR